MVRAGDRLPSVCDLACSNVPKNVKIVRILNILLGAGGWGGGGGGFVLIQKTKYNHSLHQNR